MPLLIEKHNNAEFFTADIFDQTPFKDDIASMEHPVFTLSTKPDLRQIEYKNGNKEIKISPHFEYGLPTIFDKDLLLYCASLLMSEINQGKTPPRSIRISPHDFFIATNRHTDNKIGGNNYRLLKKSLDRLAGCSIRTNIKTNGRHITEGFGVLDTYRIIESHRIKDRMVRLEVVVSQWFYNSVISREMLTINRDYFRLRKPIERRLYEIARKHCGNQRSWSIGLESLFNKSGSKDRLAKFKAALKIIIQDDHIPDYQYSLNREDKVRITNKNWKDTVKKVELMDDSLPLLSQLNTQTIKNAQKIHENSYTDWELKEIAFQFYQFTQKKGMPNDINKAFIGFLKKKVTTYKKDSIDA